MKTSLSLLLVLLFGSQTCHAQHSAASKQLQFLRETLQRAESLDHEQARPYHEIAKAQLSWLRKLPKTKSQRWATTQVAWRMKYGQLRHWADDVGVTPAANVLLTSGSVIDRDLREFAWQCHGRDISEAIQQQREQFVWHFVLTEEEREAERRRILATIPPAPPSPE